MQRPAIGSICAPDHSVAVLQGFFRRTRTCQRAACREPMVHYTFWTLRCRRPVHKREPSMADQLVITEKTSQAKDIRAAVGSRYGDVLPAEGHLFDLLEPEDVVPAWKRWSAILLRPEGLYGTRPAEGGNKISRRSSTVLTLGMTAWWLAPSSPRRSSAGERAHSRPEQSELRCHVCMD